MSASNVGHTGASATCHGCMALHRVGWNAQQIANDHYAPRPALPESEAPADEQLSDSDIEPGYRFTGEDAIRRARAMRPPESDETRDDDLDDLRRAYDACLRHGAPEAARNIYQKLGELLRARLASSSQGEPTT